MRRLQAVSQQKREFRARENSKIVILIYESSPEKKIKLLMKLSLLTSALPSKSQCCGPPAKLRFLSDAVIESVYL
jgi:hypothetical protein